MDRSILRRTPLAGLIPGGLCAKHIQVHQQKDGKSTGKTYHEVCLVCTHSASLDRKNGGRTTVRRGLFYRFRGYTTNSKPGKFLKFSTDMGACGNMAADQYEQALRTGSPDGPSRGVAHSSCSFDFTALCYILGFVCSRTALNLPVELPTLPNVEVYSFYAHFDAYSANEPVITKALYCGSHEFVTLMCLLSLAGTKRVFTTAKTVCSQGNVLTGMALCHYALGTACRIIGAAAELSCGVPHYLAWFRGATAGVTLCCHCDEGGWLRKVFKNATYPIATGVVPDSSKALFDYPQRASYRHIDAGGRFLEAYLTCVRCITAADPISKEHGCLTALEREEGASSSTVADFPTLEDLFENWLLNFGRCLAKCVGMAEPDLSMMHTFKEYWSTQPKDKHLNQPVLVPFYMVEPAPLNVFADVDDPFPHIGNCLRPATMPMLGTRREAVVRMRDYTDDYSGTGFRNSHVRFVTRGFTLRSLGLSYVWDGSGANNYLHCVRPIIDERAGYNHRELALARNSDTHTLSSRRWITPHAPVPHPSECWGGSRKRLFEITFSGRESQGNFDDLVHGVVKMTCSTFSYSATSIAALPENGKHVPDVLKFDFAGLDKCRMRVDDNANIYMDPLPMGDGGSISVTPIFVQGQAFATPVSPPSIATEVSLLIPATDSQIRTEEGEQISVTSTAFPESSSGPIIYTKTAADSAINLQARNISAAGAAAVRTQPPPKPALTGGADKKDDDDVFSTPTAQPSRPRVTVATSRPTEAEPHIQPHGGDLKIGVLPRGDSE